MIQVDQIYKMINEYFNLKVIKSWYRRKSKSLDSPLK